MKSTFIKFGVLIASMALVACQTHTRPENIADGAVSDAVASSITASKVSSRESSGQTKVAVALVGGTISDSMDSNDNQEVVKILDDTDNVNKPHYWKNENTGNKYKLMVISERIAYKGYSDCRRYHIVAMINEQKESSTAIACRMKNGAWKTA